MNHSHVNKGFNVIAKMETPSKAMIYSFMISTTFLKFYPNGVRCSIIVLDRVYDPILNKMTIDL